VASDSDLVRFAFSAKKSYRSFAGLRFLFLYRHAPLYTVGIYFKSGNDSRLDDNVSESGKGCFRLASCWKFLTGALKAPTEDFWISFRRMRGCKVDCGEPV